MSPINRNLSASSGPVRRLWRVVPLALAVFLPLASIAGHFAARAQTPDAPSKPPKEVLALFDDIDDINKLRALNPLKLTPDQMDKIAAAIVAAQADYDKKATDLIVPPVQKMATEIRDVKKRALAGGAIPKDFDDRIVKLQDDYLKQRDKLNFDNFRSLIDKIKAILTVQQIETATKYAKSTQKTDDASDDSQDAKWFNFYILHAFINYPRAVPLLKEMRAAADAPKP